MRLKKLKLFKPGCLNSSIADPGFLNPGSGNQDGKNPDPGSYIRDIISIPDHISESLKQFWVKNTEFFSQFCVADPGSGAFLPLDPESGVDRIWIREKHPGSATVFKSKLRTVRSSQNVKTIRGMVRYVWYCTGTNLIMYRR